MIENPRIVEEIELLKKQFENVACLTVDQSYWFQIEPFRIPANCQPGKITLVFSVTTGHPGPAPYGFYIPAELVRNGSRIDASNPPSPPPFDGNWRFISHQPEHWRPAANVTEGDNLWGWARSIRERIGSGG